MKLRRFGVIAVLVAAVAVAASVPSRRQLDQADEDGTDTRTTEPGHTNAPADVIDLDGLTDASFGDTEQDLLRRGVAVNQPDSCGPLLTGHQDVSPVFADDRLVLLWASPPMRTPEGVTAGTPVSQVQASYPEATRLIAPHGTYRFDGLLARRGDRAYLFLHDGQTVRKTIVGYAKYARLSFADGHGPC